MAKPPILWNTVVFARHNLTWILIVNSLISKLWNFQILKNFRNFKNLNFQIKNFNLSKLKLFRFVKEYGFIADLAKPLDIFSLLSPVIFTQPPKFFTSKRLWNSIYYIARIIYNTSELVIHFQQGILNQSHHRRQLNQMMVMIATTTTHVHQRMLLKANSTFHIKIQLNMFSAVNMGSVTSWTVPVDWFGMRPPTLATIRQFHHQPLHEFQHQPLHEFQHHPLQQFQHQPRQLFERHQPRLEQE